MKILVMPGHFYPSIGGSEENGLKLVKFFQSRGDEVIVVSRLYKNSREFEIYSGIPVYRIRYCVVRLNLKFLICSAADFIRSLSSFKKIVDNFKPQLIYIHLLQENAILAAALSFFYKCRIILSLQGYDMILCKNNIINRRLFKRLLNISEKIFFVSEALYSKAKDETKYSFEKRKIEIRPTGVDLAEFDMGAEKFVLPDNRQYIFGCGSLIYYKQFDVLIRGFHSVSNKYPSIDLVIAGDGPERKNLESLSNDLNISDRVHFLGYVDRKEVPKYYAGCLFFVLTTHFEAFGTVILEAMAARKAVIGSNSGGTPELVKDNYNGFLFEDGDSPMLAEKISFLIENSEERERFGSNGRKLIEKEYTWDKVYSRRSVL